MPEDHEHRWTKWYTMNEGVDGSCMWQRDCTVEGCNWHQHSSTDPNNPSPLDKALGGIVGITPDDPNQELLEAVGDVVSDVEGRGLDNASPAEQRLYNAFYVVCPPDLSTT
jgi:hypothetical protein